MLRMNLSTRPFYNERLVHLGLAALALVGGIVLLAAGVQLTQLVREQTGLRAAAELDEAQSVAITNEAVGLQQDAGASEIERLERAAREANELIERRSFSWTEFFNRIEATLPADVMLTSLRPSIDADIIEVAIGIIGRDVDAIDQFIGQLESTGAFTGVLSREEEITEAGEYRAVLIGRYLEHPPVAGEPPGEPTAALEPAL